ncbi:MAG: phage adaptor protein, partial [bacterium]
MSNYQYSSDLVNDILFKAGEPIDGTSDFDSKALTYLNRAYQALWMGGAEFDPEINEEWFWLKTTGILTLNAAITTGTIAVTDDSASITFSSAPASSLAGWHIKTNDHADVFKISAHTGGNTAATLDSVYTGTTDAAASYKAFQLEYDLASDVLTMISPMRGYQNSANKIDGISMRQLEDDWPLNMTSQNVPSRFAMVDDNTVRFNKYPSQLTRITYEYLAQPADLTDSGTEEPAVPRKYRRVLALMGAYWLLQDKNDDRRTEIGLEAKALLNAMKIENRKLWAKTGSIGWIFPRQRSRKNLIKGPLRTESGMIIG